MTQSSVEIAEVGPSHLEEMARLFDAYRVFYGQPSDVPAAQTFVNARIANGDSVIYLARGRVERAEELLGFVQLYPSFSSVAMKRLWILNDLFVIPEARKRGIGRSLIDRARRLAIETGAKGLILETAADNRTARALYEAYGFVQDTAFDRYVLDV